MRTITNLNDIYWAYAEMHEAASVILGGERKEYTLSDGHIIYVTDEERRFLEAIRDLGNNTMAVVPVVKLNTDPVVPVAKPDTTPEANDGCSADELSNATEAHHHDEDKPAGTEQISLFGCLRKLKRYGYTGKSRKTASESARGYVDRMDNVIKGAVAGAFKSVKEITAELNAKQREMTAERTIESVWATLGERFDKALAKATSKLVCSSNEDAYDRFLVGFIEGHARVGINKYGRAILYTTECTLGCESERIEYPPRNKVLKHDLTYGELLGKPDSLTLQLHMLQMYRVMPKYASNCYGTGGSGISGIVGELSKRNGGRVSNEEVAHMYERYFPALEDAIDRGVKRVMSFISYSPYYDRIHVTDRPSVSERLSELVKQVVRRSLVQLDDDDFTDIMKTIDDIRGGSSNVFRRRPGGIIMKYIRLAFHWIIWDNYKHRQY